MKKKTVQIPAKRIKIRGGWGTIKPYTRVEPDKTKYNRKQKHRKQEEE